jgi:hypothetical protein
MWRFALQAAIGATDERWPARCARSCSRSVAHARAEVDQRAVEHRFAAVLRVLELREELAELAPCGTAVIFAYCSMLSGVFFVVRTSSGADP